MSPPSEVDLNLAATLRELRDRQGRSQEALAHDAGLTVATLARIERGKSNPTWTTVRSIAVALGITLADLGKAVEKRSTS